jgi:hypothetical protein
LQTSKPCDKIYVRNFFGGIMKFLEKFFYHACAYSLAISVFFFGFAALTGMDSIAISIDRYFLIVAFSFFISAAEFIFSTKIHIVLKYVIHFISLFIAFFFVFIGVGSAANGFTAPFVFSAIIIFTLIYFIIFFFVILARRIIKKISENTPLKAEKEVYKSRFK